MINKYLIFKISNESYALSTNYVMCINEMMKIVIVPKTPNYVKGMINYNGNPIMVIDSHILLGIKHTNYSTNSCILILDIPIDDTVVKIGIIVDEVNTVIDIEDDNIDYTNKIINKYINGIFNNNGDMIFLLSPSKKTITSLV